MSDSEKATDIESHLASLPETTHTITPSKAYHRHDKFLTKRTLKPGEYETKPDGTITIPRLMKERLKNEAATLAYIKRETNIPVPKLHGCLDIDDVYMVIMEFVEGVQMGDLEPEQKRVVEEELEGYLATLRKLKSDTLGSVSGLVIPPRRALSSLDDGEWEMNGKEDSKGEYVFCHNDLSEDNVLVDPVTLKIQAIIGWQFAGFYPASFEMSISRDEVVSREGEEDDSKELVQFLKGAKMNSEK